MRFLGIDYGTRRIGLAAGDELGIATPLPALVEADAAARRRALAQVVQTRRIQEIVLGLPLNMDGSEGFKAKESQAFAEELIAAAERTISAPLERRTRLLAAATSQRAEARRFMERVGALF